MPEMTTIETPPPTAAGHSRPADAVATELGVDPEQGLGPEEVAQRLTQYGPNELPKEPPPSTWEVAKGQLTNPMNIMLIIVGAASFALSPVATGVVVLAP